MSNVLGLLAFVGYVAAIVGLAAGVTWIVVRWTPAEEEAGQPGAQLDRRERQHVGERRVVEAMRLGDRLVRDLAV